MIDRVLGISSCGPCGPRNIMDMNRHRVATDEQKEKDGDGNLRRLDGIHCECNGRWIDGHNPLQRIRKIWTGQEWVIVAIMLYLHPSLMNIRRSILRAHCHST